MKKDRRVILVSNSAYPLPDSGGGSIIIYRHLKRLEIEGFKILLVNTFPKKVSKGPFEEQSIKRKWWFPPLIKRYQILVRLRCYLESIYIRQQCGINKNDIIISVLGEYLNLSASIAAQKAGISHCLFYHDDHIFNSDGKINILSPRSYIKIINKAKVVFTVSEEMRDLVLKNTDAKNVKILYPVPEGKTFEEIPEWRDEFAITISACYAGSVFIFAYDTVMNIIRSLQNINSRLTIITKQYEEVIAQFSEPNLIVHHPYNTLEELKNEIVAHYSLNTVFYSFDPEYEIRMMSSFPSKFIEYLYIGIPILIIAPAFSTIGKWALANNWLAYSSTENVDDLTNLLKKFRERDFWELCQKQLFEVAHSQFNPDDIHQVFEDEIGV